MSVIKYKQFKNGIYGYRYRGYYIRYNKPEKSFDVLSPTLQLITDSLDNKYKAQEVVLRDESGKYPGVNIEDLTVLPLFKISSLILDLSNKNDEEGLSDEEKYMYDYAVTLSELN